MNEARFEVEIRPEDARRFAELSGDWNPLHTDSAYAAATAYGKPILHGAFSAGLVSRMAGMYLPGSDCLLHSLNLRLVEPIVPPAALVVEGRITRMTAEAGRAEISVTDRQSGVTYVTGSYTFGYQIREPTAIAFAATPATNTSDNAGEARVLVTGAAGGLARAVLAALGGRGAAISRSLTAEAIHATSAADLSAQLGATPIAGIVHCGWPSPDNTPMIGGGDVEQRFATT